MLNKQIVILFYSKKQYLKLILIFPMSGLHTYCLFEMNLLFLPDRHPRATILDNIFYETQINQKTVIHDPNGLNHGGFYYTMDTFTSIDDFQFRKVTAYSGSFSRNLITKT